jgi:hypothetical protein
MKYHTVKGVEQPGHVHPHAAERGAKAFAGGKGRAENPFAPDKQPFSRAAWDGAWIGAERAARAAS